MRRILHLIAATLLLASPALAAGKAGLWTVTTTWQFSPPFVPGALAAMARQQGLPSPRNGQPFVHHMCMTPYEADGRQPMHLNSRDYDCVPRVVSFRRSLMVIQTICHGQVEGVGRSQITWRGAAMTWSWWRGMWRGWRRSRAGLSKEARRAKSSPQT